MHEKHSVDEGLGDLAPGTALRPRRPAGMLLGGMEYTSEYTNIYVEKFLNHLSLVDLDTYRTLQYQRDVIYYKFSEKLFTKSYAYEVPLIFNTF
jgi:hypothetical protein